MPLYVVEAKDGPTKRVTREVIAENRSGAITQVEAIGLHPMAVREATGTTGTGKTAKLRSRIRFGDVTLLTSQLGSMLHGGVPMLRALHLVSEQASKPSIAHITNRLEQRVRDGAMLSEAMAELPKCFPEIYISMVRAGEASGTLDTILINLAEERTRQLESRRQLQGAMIYPALVLAAGVATVLVMLGFLMPRVMRLFESMDDLPKPTYILIRTSELLQGNWHWLVLWAVLGVAIFVRLFRRGPGRHALDRGLLNLPIIGKMLVQSNLAQCCHVLALLLKSGIAIERALALSSATVRNVALRDELESLTEATVTQGEPLSFGFRQASLIPAFVANMVAVGEENGNMEGALEEVSAFYDREVLRFSRICSTLVEPVLLLVVGSIVGFIVFAMLLPIFQVGSGMR
jgi:type II secretory pathway component PulF